MNYPVDQAAWGNVHGIQQAAWRSLAHHGHALAIGLDHQERRFAGGGRRWLLGVEGFDVVGILGGYLVGVVLLGVSSGSYFSGMVQSVVPLDINGGIVKSLVFGLTIILVACYKGYYTQHGAEGVSKATNQTVVLSAVLILAWDYVLTSFFM